MNPVPADFDASARAVIEDLKVRFPDTPFLALGQTALWDEPTKAALRRALDALWPHARLIAGAHDTDYFAKLPPQGRAAAPARAKYVLVGHDDAHTRGLWSATGEMSRLFGSEDVPTQHKLEEAAGVWLHEAAALAPDPDAFLHAVTSAWGWTGIVHAERGHRLIALDVPLRDVLPTLLEQIDQTLAGSEACLESQADSTVAGALRQWVNEFAARRPEASLPDLYQDLFPRLYGLLLGQAPANLTTTRTSDLLRFNRETARLPRFALVECFVNPDTRAHAVHAYDRAVAGTEMYTLDRFGSDGAALPFDLVIPGRGRGTLHLKDDGSLLIDLDRPLVISAPTAGDTGPITTIDQLAGRVEDALGPDVTLVGKAITLLPMLAAEFILVFHEGASGYSDRTRHLVEYLHESGVELPALRPILRARYHTWDALQAAPEEVGFHLPEHLAAVFGQGRISAAEFASCWPCAVQRAEHRLSELCETRSPRALLAYLRRNSAGTDQAANEWDALAREHEATRVRLLALWHQAQAIQGRVYTLYDQVRTLKREVTDWEKRKGDDYRARVKPLRERLGQIGAASGIAAAADPDEANRLEQQIAALEQERALVFDSEIQQRLGQIRFALATVRDLKAKRLQLERGPEATEARATLARIHAEAERAKAHLAADALRVRDGLPHTNFRPSAWWFPLVDPSLAWFRRLSETAEYYLEPLSPAS
jgi:hypothetical protein